MPKIISFIGWHNSGKTTIAGKVVSELVRRGRRVAVVKSTKEKALSCDKEGSDSSTFFQAGAAVLLAGEDFLSLQLAEPKSPLVELAARFFSDMDFVIGEGFKQENGIAKIEVFTGEAPQLANEVEGVIAVVGEGSGGDWRKFSSEEYCEIADFIEDYLVATE